MREGGQSTNLNHLFLFDGKGRDFSSNDKKKTFHTIMILFHIVRDISEYLIYQQVINSLAFRGIP